jgi:hypothetical protein
MRKSIIIKVTIILVLCGGLQVSRASAQGIRNDGGVVIIAGGTTVICQGGLTNNSGSVTNDGQLSLSGGLTNAGTVEGDGLLYVGGNWINSGIFDPGTGTIVFNGTQPQSVSAPYLTLFNNLEISAASSGTTIEPGAMVTVEGSTFSPNGKLTIGSDGVNSTGSLIYTGAGTPSGDIIFNRSLPGGILYHYISSPVGEDLLPAGSTFWAWDEVAGSWGDPVTLCVSGIGYTVRSGDDPLSFAGPLVREADITATSPYITDYSTGTPEEYTARIARDPFGGGGWNLLGNPFTSAMKVGGTGGFLDANDGDGTVETNMFDPNYVAVYIYDGDSYHYRGRDIDFPDPFQGEDPANEIFGFDNIQAGQGFFVLAMKDGVSFHFDNSMQVHETGTTIMKSAPAEQYWPGVQLRAACGGEISYTTVAYNEEMTAGLDPGYDVGLLSSGAEAEIYTALAGAVSSVNFARQLLPVSGAGKIILPVGVDSDNGGEVTFSAFAVPMDDTKYWLEDRVKGIFTDIGTRDYTVLLPARTYGTGRFFLHASATMPTGVEAETDDNDSGLRIWAYNGKIIIRGTVSKGSLCEGYDTGGRKLLMSRLADDGLNTVDLPERIHGVMVIRVLDGKKITVARIAVP